MVKKLMKIAICVLAVCAVVSIRAAADQSGHEQAGELYPYLSEDGREAADGGKTDTGYDLNTGLGEILSKGARELNGILSKGLSCAAKLLAISLLCAAVATLMPEGVGPFAVNTASALCIIIVGSVELNSTLGIASQFQNDLNLFSKALLPTLTAAGVAAGTAGASVAKQSAAMLFSDLLITLFTNLFMPIIYMVVALRAVGIVSGNPFFAKISASIKNTVSIIIKYLLTLYFAYISIMGLVGAAADSLAKKAAKTAVSTGIPVVGGVLGEAAETIFAGATLIKNSIGIFGVLSILGSALTPLLSSGLSYLALRGAALLSTAIPDNGSHAAIEALADAMSMVFAMCCATTALLIITVIIFMKTSGV